MDMAQTALDWYMHTRETEKLIEKSECDDGSDHDVEPDMIEIDQNLCSFFLKEARFCPTRFKLNEVVRCPLTHYLLVLERTERLRLAPLFAPLIALARSLGMMLRLVVFTTPTIPEVPLSWPIFLLIDDVQKCPLLHIPSQTEWKCPVSRG